MMPILSGLILSVPRTVLTSRASVGRWIRRLDLLLTPEETNTRQSWLQLEERNGPADAAVDRRRSIRPPGAAVPTMAAPTPAATFAPVNVSSAGDRTALVTTNLAKPQR